MTTEQELLKTHLTRVLDRGKAIVPALHAVTGELPAGRHKARMVEMVDVIEHGDVNRAVTAVSDSPDYWLPLLSAATASNDPARVLREFLDETERSSTLRRQWRRMLAYPLILLGLIVVLLAMFSFWIAPVFRQMYQEFRTSLPHLTVFILHLAWLIESGRILIVLVIALVAGFLLATARRLFPQSVRNWFADRFGMVFGGANAIAQFTRFLADLLEAGLEIPAALKIASFATAHAGLGRAASRIADEMPASSVVASYARPMATIQYALSADLLIGARIHLLRALSANYAAKARARYSWSWGVVEPLAILVIGLMVLGTVIALFLPLVMLVEALT